MSIQKITQGELLSTGVRSLPNRPSSPSLYSGRTLSATELKEAFDKLPTLIAERFNALLEAAGLYDEEHPCERLSELIATGLEESPSLAAFFEDVKNGNLALYLSLDGEAALATVIEEMRREIARLQGTVFTVEGEGDLLSGLEVEEPFIILRRDKKSEDIVKEANRYTDAPRGSVREGCTLPVSGEQVAAALHALEAKTDAGLDARVTALEEAGRGNLYSYPTTECVASRLIADKNTLLHGLLSRLGGTLPKSKNMLPEHILTTFRSDTLSIGWDRERACLVLNGTLTPEEGEVPLAVFYHPTQMACYAGGSFCRGGSIHGGESADVTLAFHTANGETVPIPLRNEDVTFTDFFLETDATRFARITLSTTAPVVFEEYLCNLFLEETDSLAPVVYSPFDPWDTLRDFPRYVTARGANFWEGERTLRGKGTVRFDATNAVAGDMAVMSFYGVSDCPTENIKILIRLASGGSHVATRQKNQRSYISFGIASPIQSITFYITNYENDESPYTLEIQDLQLEHTSDRRAEPLPYSEPFSYTRAFPESLARYRDDFIGMGNASCNYFDFEHGLFVRNLRRFTVDHTLSFVADDTASNRYYATTTVPEGLFTGDFFPTSILEALPIDYETEEGCIWFLDGVVVLQSALFPTVEILKEFLALHPIEVLYAAEAQFELLTEEERDTLWPFFLPLGPGATVELTAEDGTPAECFVQMQQQIKNVTEVTV